MEITVSRLRSPESLKRSGLFVYYCRPGLKKEGESYLYFPNQIDKLQFNEDSLNRAIADRLEIKVNGMENVKLSGPTTYLIFVKIRLSLISGSARQYP